MSAHCLFLFAESECQTHISFKHEYNMSIFVQLKNYTLDEIP